MYENFLQAYARKSIWCSPYQDMQAIFQPARITKAPGSLGVFYLNGRRYDLPDNTNRYFVYVVGKLSHTQVGIEPAVSSWMRLSDVCNDKQMIMHVYTTNGVSVPLHRCFYRYNYDGNLIFAIPNLGKMKIDLETEPVFIKFYTNAYFFTDESSAIADEIKVLGATIRDINDIMAFQNATDAYKSNPLGKPVFYVNGYRVDKITLSNTTSGDLVEMVYDGTIRNEFAVRISDLKDFVSIIDNEPKYLVMNPEVRNTIDYIDDVEFYVATTADAKKAVYYHKNMANPRSARMVTHQDYSIRVASVTALCNALGVGNASDAYITVIVRKGGYTRSLSTNAHRTHELFKLPFNKRQAAMVGIDATVDVWRAANLEASAYVQTMGLLRVPVSVQMAEDALGYNTISNILGKSPLDPIVQSGIKSVHLPYGLIDRATVYSYDSAGKLISHAVHHGIGEDVVLPANADMVQVFSGIADTMFDDQYGRDFEISPYNEYRFYKAENTGDNSKLVWEDVTGSNDYIMGPVGGSWNIDLDKYVVIVRSDAKFVHREIQHSTVFGTVEILLNEVEGGLQTRMQIPPGTVDVFMNEYQLTNGIDYHYTFPKVTIVNKRYLVNPGSASQRITIRCMAFPRKDLSSEPLEDAGFIIAGRLSNNSRYDLRDDKVQQVVIGGMLHRVSEVPFAENSSFSPYLDSMNGTPYHIKDVIVPTRGLTISNTVDLREKSIIIDKQISNYLSEMLPDIEDEFYTIPEKYPVISPFFSRMTVLVRSGVITRDEITGHLTDEKVLNICNRYAEFLQHDPTQSGNEPDDRFVVVIPHMYDYVVDLTPEQYRFLDRVNKLVCNNVLDMSHFYTISS